jgi:hypothetical protein
MLPPRKRFLDLGALFVLLILPLILFWSVTLGSKTLLPADNLYQWEPYRSFATQQGVSLPPQNALLSDLVLENLAWKQFVVQSLRAGELPLWSPYLFAGAPFLAAGQHSALYPPSVLFYALPLPRAYGLFTLLQLWWAGVFMYLFVRVLRQGRFPALIAGITYQLSAFFLVSAVHIMIIAAAAWLPLLLAVIETMVRKQEERECDPFVPVVYVALGAVALGMHVLAGHPEILLYTLVVMVYYSLIRLVMLWRHVGAWWPALRLAAWLALMVGLGLGLGLIQLIPMFELVNASHREGLVTYADVVSWAYPPSQFATFLVPDYFGNPTHHGYWDLVSRQWVPANPIFWGTKNYVEAGSYVGILPLVLTAVAVLAAIFKPGGGWRPAERRYIWLFAALAYASLLFVFGTPLYLVLYYGLPGIKQLHSPFRWVFPYTLSVAVLAGFGARRLVDLRNDFEVDSKTDEQFSHQAYRRWVCLLTWGVLGIGLVLGVLLIVVLIAPGSFIPMGDRFLAAVEEAREVFTSGQMFLSYQWPNFLALSLMLIASGVVLRIARCPACLSLPRSLISRFPNLRLPIWQSLTVTVVAVDLLLFGWGFNPAADPAWLEFTPPAIEFLKERAEKGEPWRLTTFQVKGSNQTLNANIPWLHDLEDVRGYDSIVPRQYVEYMRVLEGQGELFYNRIAPIYGLMNLSSPLLDLLNVRYVVTEGGIPNLDYELVYDGEVRIYENTDALPRAFALPRAKVVSEATLPTYLHTFDPRQVVLLEKRPGLAEGTRFVSGDWPLQPAAVVTHTANVVLVDVNMPGPGWLVLTDSYFPGWKAYRSDPVGRLNETELEIVRADGNFRAVWLEAGTHRIRFQYAPASFKLGLYGSLTAIVVLFLLILYRLRAGCSREQ